MIQKRKIIVIILILICGFFNLQTTNVMGVDVYDVYGNTYKGEVDPYKSIHLNFINFHKKFSLHTDVHINFNIEYLSPLLNRQIELYINNSNPISLNISFNPRIDDFISTPLPEEPIIGNTTLSFRYNSIMKIVSNSTIENIRFIIEKSSSLGLFPNQNYTIVYYKKTLSSWQVIPTDTIVWGVTHNEGVKIIDCLEGNISELQGNEEYFFTIYNIYQGFDNPPPEMYFLILFIIIIGLALVIIVYLILAIAKSLFLVISKGDYLNFLKHRTTSFKKGVHRLSLKDVLTNKNRNKIIDIVLEIPGIHFRKLLRLSELSPGNLFWHLEILETYKIIKKERFENCVVYFPYYQENMGSRLNLKLQKNELTIKVLEMVNNNPGIWNNKITRELKSNRKTIEYHVKKLIDLGLIYAKKIGRKNILFRNVNQDNK